MRIGRGRKMDRPKWAEAFGVMTDADLEESRRKKQEAKEAAQARRNLCMYSPRPRPTEFVPSDEWLRKRST